MYMQLLGSNQVAFHDTSSSTIRTSSCAVLVRPKVRTEIEVRCSCCSNYRKTLNSMLFRAAKQDKSGADGSDPSSHVNFRYLSSPQKVNRLQKLHKSVRVSNQRVERLKTRLASVIEKRGIQVESDLHEDLTNIMQDNSKKITDSYPADSFARIFWEQQIKASSLKDARSMKWEPMMIRWLYIVS